MKIGGAFLRETDITDRSLKALATHCDIWWLYLGATGITDAGVSYIARHQPAVRNGGDTCANREKACVSSFNGK